MKAISADPTAVRVARRHAREAEIILQYVPAERLRIEYTESGTVSAVQVAKILRPQLGVLTKMRFRRSLAVDPNGISWEALDEHANVVSGRLILHATVSETEVSTWAELTVDRPKAADPRR